MGRSGVGLALLLIALALTGCFDDKGLKRCSGAAAADLSPKSVAVKPGETVSFALPAEANGLSVAWKTNAIPSGGNISQDGVFTAPDKPGVYGVSAEYRLADGTDVAAQASISVESSDAKSEGSPTTGGDDSLSVDESTGVDADSSGSAATGVDPATVERIFDSGNIYAVSNGGKPVAFTITTSRRVREIGTYHWNDEKGTGGGGTITLAGPGGTQSFKANRTLAGQGGVPNAYWVADVDITLQPGTYTISDSDPGTWAQNSQSKGKGMAWVQADKQ